MLCYRCEHRAKAWESENGPRNECHFDRTHSVISCYMYQPVKPIILKRDSKDKRPQFAHFTLSARSKGVGICEDLQLKVINYGKKGKALIWFKPSDI